jgi:hypothetical protein
MCRFNAEIVPVPTSIKDANGNVSKVVIERDDGIRASTDSAALAKLKVVHYTLTPNTAPF